MQKLKARTVGVFSVDLEDDGDISTHTKYTQVDLEFLLTTQPPKRKKKEMLLHLFFKRSADLSL